MFNNEKFDTDNSVLEAFAESYRPKGGQIDKFQEMNAEIRSLLLKITPDPYANIHREQLNLLTGERLTSQERYAISNEINRTTQSIIAPYLQAVDGTLSTKSGGGKRRKTNTATRKSYAKKGGKPNSARGNRSGTRRRGRFGRSRSLPRKKGVGERSRDGHSKPNQRARTRRPLRK